MDPNRHVARERGPSRPNLPLAQLLGTYRTHALLPSQLPAAGECARLGEPRAFASRCAAPSRALDHALSRARGRSGLVIEYVGRNVWGVGHVLTLVYALHYVCRRLRRYCYVRLWDSQLEELFTYANGESWAPPSDAALLAAYGACRHRPPPLCLALSSAAALSFAPK